MEQQIDWLLACTEPWTRYRALTELLALPECDHLVRSARQEMLAHPQIQWLIEQASAWPGYPLKRHNDAKHPIYAISTLADFGLKAGDPGIDEIASNVIKHKSPQGMLETQIFIPEAFGGSGHAEWSWVLCDSPTLLYSLLSFGDGAAASLEPAVDYLSALVRENGWCCTASPDLGKFKGPGRRADPCPIANVYVLKALSVAGSFDVRAARISTEMLLGHWQRRKERKYFLFGMGTDFARLKYPFVWYDILHVVEVLSRFEWVHGDPRFMEMLEVITNQADADGRFTATSMYMAWKGWSFADKKHPSPWITFLVLSILNRVQSASN